MRPGPLLLIAAPLLGAVHVTGVLFARPVLRPAELLAVLGLLLSAIRSDLRSGRAGGGLARAAVKWGLTRQNGDRHAPER